MGAEPGGFSRSRDDLPASNPASASEQELERLWRGEISRTKLFIAILIAVLVVQLIASIGGLIGIALLILALIALGVAALLWGADSRDGHDW
jgi:Flp pilus assembly protein TadB